MPARTRTRSVALTVLRNRVNEVSTGPADITQVSFEPPPRCIDTTRTSALLATRVRPPGITT